MTDKNFDEIAKKLKPIDLPPLDENPLVSVLIANYNYGRFVGGAIESILNQTYQNFEITVCDDGSTDDSREVVKRYGERDPRVKLVVKANGGYCSAYNAAYAASKGEVVCLLDSDDTFLAQKVGEVVRAFREFPRAGVCHHKLQKVDERGRPLGCAFPVVFAEGWVALDALRGGGMVKHLPSRQVSATSGMAWRREVADLLFPAPVDFLGLDAYLSQASQFVTEVCAIRRVLAIYNYHGVDSQTGDIQFTAAFVRKNLGTISDTTALLRQFLRARYGEAIASRLRIEDNNVYCCHVAALHVLTGERQNGDGGNGEPLGKVVARIQPFRQRALVRLFLALPPRASRRLLRLWVGKSRLDTAVLRAARRLIRV
jgi:hypothetical protein